MSVNPQVLSQLENLIDENTQKPYGKVWQVEEHQGVLSVTLTLPYPAQTEFAAIKTRVEEALDQVVSLVLRTDVKAGSTQDANNPGMQGVKNIIAIASGKGGVGKSTTTVNLALAMAREGAKVGILDADIYGPSQGLLLGFDADTRPRVRDEKYFVPPVAAHGIKVMSMAFLTTKETPMAWRGPMATGALMQILTQTDWDDLDYLFVDMPPGTGDIQLTLSQKVPVAGSVVVTTPQDIALLDARRGIEMFNKVSIPVLGVVENMSTHICSNCGHAEAIFGEAGGKALSAEYGVEELGKLPLSLSIREQADAGKPTVLSAPDSDTAAIYQSIARKVGATLAARTGQFSMPTIGMSDD
ncbi:iron-sulfur cluster carrier protein ApbC [Marinomonas ostreistagni]|uniref:iron-sulfur cluster carrier protein ApbC n=1 Tax=Marinomonas ostreistagni TaxID=359209 RepID=UPI0019515B37|nr:iron-sulfur cluster carrier protein ApbC [Marinomonas ostreistagni]MBM6551779.1 iron-sulfur cluster carrier protein ApbC [Marinomonas ostreistagni]